MWWSRPRSAAATNVPVVAGTSGRSARPLTSATVVDRSPGWSRGTRAASTTKRSTTSSLECPTPPIPRSSPWCSRCAWSSRSRTGCSPRCARPSGRTIATCAVSDGRERVGAGTGWVSPRSARLGQRWRDTPSMVGSSRPLRPSRRVLEALAGAVLPPSGLDERVIGCTRQSHCDQRASEAAPYRAICVRGRSPLSRRSH